MRNAFPAKTYVARKSGLRSVIKWFDTLEDGGIGSARDGAWTFRATDGNGLFLPEESYFLLQMLYLVASFNYSHSMHR